MRTIGALDALLRNDRRLVLGGLAAVSLLAWAYILRLAWQMPAGMEMIATAQARPWNATDMAMTFVMWGVMMVAMMVPSAAPMVLTYSMIVRKQDPGLAHGRAVAAFVLGYIVIWTIFSLVVTLLQWRLHMATVLTAGGASTTQLFGGTLLLAAGVFQWTPLKQACLSHCRSPLGFFMTRFRSGTLGAFTMGLEHGGFCVGCCWALMGLLFVAGVMNLAWVAAITAFVLAEKLLPAGRALGRLAGIVMIGWGLYLIGLGL